MRFYLQVQMDNVQGDAVGHARAKEVARLLERAAHQVRFNAPLNVGSKNLLRDQVGNRVGVWRVDNERADVPD